MSYHEYDYKCPTCSATKRIIDHHGQSAPSASVPCGWRGCTDRAVRVPTHPTHANGYPVGYYPSA